MERVHSNLKLVAKIPLANRAVENDGANELKQRKLDFSRPVEKMLEPGEVRRHVLPDRKKHYLKIWTKPMKVWKMNARKRLTPKNTLKRQKEAISCKRFRGRHASNAVATELENIFSRYGLNIKVTALSNFVKAFKEFQKGQPESDEEKEEEASDVTFTDLHNVLTIATDEDDVDKWLASSPNSMAVYRSATGKCAALGTKAIHSTVVSEYLEEVSDKKLIVPSVTLSNSSIMPTYALIIEIPIANINKHCPRLNMNCRNNKEYQFLKEYCLIMKPFTIALDILTGEDPCFYGTLLPTLEILMVKSLSNKNDLSNMTVALTDIIVKGIKSLFAATLDSKDALLAAVSLPKFKLRWVSEKPRNDYIKFLLTQECSSFSEELPVHMPDPHPAAALYDSNAPMSVETEEIDYLKSAPVMWHSGITPQHNPVHQSKGFSV
ncbi:unnamed protein product [Lepeophtheirus salmonis]|uniref:(salmon louse) hypothetical protein n=1 Tax=Lepeophtheirus salmonis TaxID=72036 RepID=A0A7R8CVB9_LEPSM|nr:unnamed protein product [Lepeophtheirus salmonis]CAF2942140.1 unnamed protein product [Lepeophtheirus salmonis]